MHRDLNITAAGRVAIVTGGGSGLGRTVSRLLAQAGAVVNVCDIDFGAARETVQQIAGLGLSATPHKMDVTNVVEVREIVRVIHQDQGPIDVLVNNAGVEEPLNQLLTATADSSWSRIIQTNLSGVFYTMREVIPDMVAAGGGAIINVASVKALVAFSGSAAYNASKAGVAMLTRTAALEFATKNVRINAVCPGAILDTGMTRDYLDGATDPVFERRLMDAIQPVNRSADSIEVARLIVFLASDLASYITGAVLPVDGGLSAGLSPNLSHPVGE